MKNTIGSVCCTVIFILTCNLLQAQQPSPSIQWQKVYGGSGDDEATSIQQTKDGGYIVGGFSNSNDGDVTGNHGLYDYWITKIDSTGNIQWKKSLGGSFNDGTHVGQNGYDVAIGGLYDVFIRQTKDGGYIVSGISESSDQQVTGHHLYTEPNYTTTDYWVVKLDATGNIQWEKSLGGSYYDGATGAQQTSDGGYIVVGFTESADGDVTGGYGQADYWVVKLDATGNIQWEKCYGGKDNDVATSIQQTSDGGYIIAGYSYSNDGEVGSNHPDAYGATTDYWIVKIDGSGNLQWGKDYGGSASDEAFCAQQTSDGGYIVSGASNSSGGDVAVNPNYGAWILKLDGSGSIQWQKSFPNAEAQTIRQTTDGGYVFAGTWSENSSSTFSSIVTKLDATGTEQWQLTFPNNLYNNWGVDLGMREGALMDVQQTKDGWYVLCGATTDSSLPDYHGNIDSWVVKFGPPLPVISSVQQQAFPLLECSPRQFDTIYIRNTGKIPLTITSATFGGTKNYYSVVSPSALPDSIAPGDSGRFIIQFAPNATGTFADTLSFFSNDNAPGHNPWKIAFTGEKESVGFSESSSQIDFGVVSKGTTKDSVLTITNTGTVQEIIQIFVSPPFYADSSFVTLVPGQTDSIRVHFSPTQDGTSYGNFCLVIPPPCYDISCIVAVGRTNADSTSDTTSRTTQLTANGLNAGTLICATLKDTSVMVTVSGANPVQIDSGTIAGTDAAAFQFIGSAFPFVTAPGVQSPIPVRFAPRHTGVSKAILILYSHQVKNSPDTILLAGVEDSVNITTDYGSISFGTALTNITKDTVVIIHNTGVTTETVKLQTAPPFSTDNSSVTILPGDSVAVKVHYLPTKVGSDKGTLTLTTNDPCAITQDVALSGNVYPSSGGQADICIVVNNPVVSVGKGPDSATVTLSQTIPLPVDSVVFDLAYDAQALLLGSVTSPSCQIAIRQIALDTVRITLTTCSSPLPAGVLCAAAFTPLVSSRDTSYTQLTVDSIQIYPLSDSITGSGCSTPVTVLPLCGLKGVLYTGATSLAQNYPNPFTGTTAIHVTLSQSDAQNARLVVCNVLGEQVADLTDQLSTNGDVTFNAGANKPGVYYYVLQTASGRITRQMFVVK